MSDGVYSSVTEPRSDGSTYDTPKEMSLIDFGDDGGQTVYDNSGKLLFKIMFRKTKLHIMQVSHFYMTVILITHAKCDLCTSIYLLLWLVMEKGAT